MQNPHILSVFRPALSGLLLLTLAGCALPPAPSDPAMPPDSSGVEASARLSADAAARQFALVVKTVEPVAEEVCREKRQDDRCNFRIAIDPRPRRPANAFQTLDDNGQPVLIFTLALIADMQNPDELAFVMSHEASHHILRHLSKQAAYANETAQAYAEAAEKAGASKAQVRRAAEKGADVGARSHANEFELQADSLGALIARAAGYDALRGAQYFNRLPDPEKEFLGSHPPNAARMENVRRTLATQTLTLPTS